MTNPKVSVIIPTYNRADLIKETIQSVFDQTFQSFEIIIVDDGSTDNTRQVVKNINSPKIKYIYQDNSGRPAHARNRALKETRGEYIAFLDSDDLWLPHKLELQVKFLDKHQDVGLVYSQAKIFGKTKGIFAIPPVARFARTGWMFDELLKINFIPTLTTLVRKKCLDRIGYFDEDPGLTSIEDYELWLRLSKEYQIGFIDQLLAEYRVHSTNLSGDFLKRLKYRLYMLQKIDGKIGTPDSLKKQILSMLHRRMAKEYIFSGDYANALKEIKISQKYHKKLSGLLYQTILIFGFGILLHLAIIVNRRLRHLIRTWKWRLSFQ